VTSLGLNACIQDTFNANDSIALSSRYHRRLDCYDCVGSNDWRTSWLLVIMELFGDRRQRDMSWRYFGHYSGGTEEDVINNLGEHSRRLD
jgi:hypothetical protein